MQLKQFLFFLLVSAASDRNNGGNSFSDREKLMMVRPATQTIPKVTSKTDVAKKVNLTLFYIWAWSRGLDDPVH